MIMLPLTQHCQTIFGKFLPLHNPLLYLTSRLPTLFHFLNSKLPLKVITTNILRTVLPKVEKVMAEVHY
jgi:hypothetical protein